MREDRSLTARNLAAVDPETAEKAEPKFDVRDCIAVVGLASLFAGAWMMYPPLGWIVLGTALLIVAWRI